MGIPDRESSASANYDALSSLLVINSRAWPFNLLWQWQTRHLFHDISAFCSAPNLLQSKFTMLWRAKDYDLLVGKTALYAHCEIKCCKSDCLSKLIAKASLTANYLYCAKPWAWKSSRKSLMRLVISSGRGASNCSISPEIGWTNSIWLAWSAWWRNWPIDRKSVV